MKLGLVIGHERRAPGATMAQPYGISEYKYNTGIARLAVDHAERYHPDVDVHVITRDQIGVAGAYAQALAKHCDCVIELHFNAANGKAAGTETLCSGEPIDMAFAQVVQDKVEAVFGRIDGGRGDRGLKKNPPRGGASVNGFKGKANCLVEPFFGDNPAEAELAMNRQAQYAASLIEAVVEWKGTAK